MKFRLKRILRRWFPLVFYNLKRHKTGKAFRVAHGGAEYRAVKKLTERTGLRVLAGPFKGMHYGRDVSCGAYVAKLVGSYEEELHDVVAQIVAKQYSTLIDVGAAEGYYAVGFARRLKSTVVYAYDIDVSAQRYCADLARLNGVQDRVTVGGECDFAELRKLAGANAVIVCDCEGFEMTLLDPVKVPQLQFTDILVELHEALRPSVTATLLDRFKGTHKICLIDTQVRDPARYPELGLIAAEDRPWAVREGRPWPMQWAWMLSHPIL